MTANTATPRVSVCLLTYNRAGVLPRSLDSLLNQTYGDFELIINDDCSPDGTEAIGRAYEARDPRVRYCRNEKNLRYAGNQNAAAERARGEYIAYVHDGDIYEPFMLERWVAAMDQFPSAGLVFNAVRVLGEHGFESQEYIHSYPPLVKGKDLFDEMVHSDSSPIFGIVMIRASALRDVGPFNTEFPVIADVDMWLRLLARYDAAYVSEPLYDVMPREVGHHNRGINWRVQAELDTICVKNVAAFHGGWPNVPKDVRRRIVWRLRRKNIWLLAYCVGKLKWKALGEGLVSLASARPFGTATRFELVPHQANKQAIA